MNILTIKKTKRTLFFVLVLTIFIVANSINPISANAFTLLTRQLKLGATGSDVTNLQTFLASNANIYPEGIISGYFGSLTQAAVERFQNTYGISPVGYVGPITMAKVNNLIESNVALTSVADINAPIIISPSVMVADIGASAVISWQTNEPTTAEVYYSTTPFKLAEANVGVSEPTITGGTDTAETTSLQTSQNISLQNLKPSTIYYYIIESTDSSGNISYTLPATFITNR